MRQGKADTKNSERNNTKHPYQSLPDKSYWKNSIGTRNPLEISDIYSPKFSILKDERIVTAGSCFAQHISKQFKNRNYGFVDLEQAPKLLPKKQHGKFGYGLYSGRYGNIYSIRQLLQMFKRADGSFIPSEIFWERDGRFFDPFRPNIEPNGFESYDELKKSLDDHLRSVSRLIKKTDVFVFTFGLTEGWVNKLDDASLPSCPGAIAGTFDSDKYEFHNFRYNEIIDDAIKFLEYAKSINPKIKFVFTVSPVPLTATATNGHVLSATVYSKSVLRAVCGELYERFENVDYFPSYELITSHPFRGMFYNPNMRTVATKGVEYVMDIFFNAHNVDGPVSPVYGSDEEKCEINTLDEGDEGDEDEFCEDAILEAFAK